MDFDFNELTASQQDLTMKHREIVAERKKEQEQEKIEKQRLEEILSMCAEYEKQIEDERTVQENPKPKTTAWSMQRFLETPQRSSESPKQAPVTLMSCIHVKSFIGKNRFRRYWWRSSLSWSNWCT
jgi:phage-related minor tail protein